MANTGGRGDIFEYRISSYYNNCYASWRACGNGESEYVCVGGCVYKCGYAWSGNCGESSSEMDHNCDVRAQNLA